MLPSPLEFVLAGLAAVISTAVVSWQNGHGAGIITGILWAAGLVVVSYWRASRRLRLELAARLEAEAALRRSLKDLEDFKYALDQAAIVATTNVRGDITYVNDTFCAIARYTREELIGRNHRLLNSGAHPVEFFREMYATIGRGRVWHGEIQNRAKDGTTYWVDTTIVPFLDERGHPYQYVAVRYDITERKQSEAALRDQKALAQLGKMAAVVAHEVRNPLAGIKGALQVIGRRMPPTTQEHGIINDIVTRIDTLNDIVQDLLLFARPIQPALATIPIGTVIEETVALFKQDPAVAGVMTDVEASTSMVSADAQQLKLVLLNLLMNGAQAMHGEGRLVVRVASTSGQHEIRIADEGPGVPPDVREHLFEPFFTTRHRGTGLGLVTARRIIEAHGGTVQLECPPTGGTVAVVTIPAR
jgi:PAS domain S-box-containing protein